MPVGDDGGSHHARKMLRYSGATLSEHLENRGKVRNETAGWRLQVTRDRKQIIKPSRINERNLRSPPRRLAHSMRQNGRLSAQVASYQEHGTKLLDLCNANAKRWVNRISRLIAEVPLPQLEVDVRRAEPARNPPQQIQLFSRARSASQH